MFSWFTVRDFPQLRWAIRPAPPTGLRADQIHPRLGWTPCGGDHGEVDQHGSTVGLLWCGATQNDTEVSATQNDTRLLNNLNDPKVCLWRWRIQNGWRWWTGHSWSCTLRYSQPSFNWNPIVIMIYSRTVINNHVFLSTLSLVCSCVSCFFLLGTLFAQAYTFMVSTLLLPRIIQATGLRSSERSRIWFSCLPALTASQLWAAIRAPNLCGSKFIQNSMP